MDVDQIEMRGEWERRFSTTSVAAATVAATNRGRGLATSNVSGVLQLYAWDVASGELRQLTDEPSGRPLGWIDSSGQSIYYLEDRKGNELGHFVRVPWQGGAAVDITPNLPLYNSRNIQESYDGRVIGLMCSTDAGFQTYRLDKLPSGELGEPVPLWYESAGTWGPIINWNGTLFVHGTTARTKTNRVSLVVVDRQGRIVGELHDEGASISWGFFARAEGDDRFFTTSNRSGFHRPVIWNPASGERHDLALPQLTGSVAVRDFDPEGELLLLEQFDEAHMQLWLYDLGAERLKRLDHPSGSFQNSFFLENGDVAAVWEDSTSPRCVIQLDIEDGHKVETLLAAGDVPPSQRWRSIHYPSTDGAVIQAWLATPEGAGPWPTIVHTHGGPDDVTKERFHPQSQAWIDHGFAFMSLNYRGSITFGLNFQRAIWHNLGDKEVEDMAAGYRWLVDNGIARPDAVFLSGGSYGGYLTLQALGRKPELWAGGMAEVAVADWTLMYEDQIEPLRRYQMTLFGGTPDERPEQYAISSPITYAEQIAAPILVIQGRNDARCPARQMRHYEERLRSFGKEIDVVWFDAGHGSHDNEQQIEHMRLRLNFARSRLSVVH